MMKHTAAAFILTTAAALAGDSFFSADGKTVTLAPEIDGGALLRVDVASGKVTPQVLPAELKDASITGLTAGAEGEALFLANDAVWVATDAGVVKKVVTTKPVVEAAGLFAGTKEDSPLMDWLFVMGKDEDAAAGNMFYARRKGGKEFGAVFCRRASRMSCGAFAADGRFFFAAQGDLWEGGFDPQDEGEGLPATLVGARIAPLALLHTDMSNSGGAWVDEIAPAGKWIYAALNGRHFGVILRTAVPAKTLFGPGGEDQPEVGDQLEAMRKSLEKTEVVVGGDMERISAFCATEVAGEPRVFFRAHRGEHGTSLWLWEGKGEPRLLGKEPAAKGE